METMYLFEDWSSVSRMRNSINCRLKVKSSVLLNDDKEVEGYQLIIYDEMTNVEYYRFYVEYGKDFTWSLTSREAVEVLNRVGFICEYKSPSYDLSDKMIETLKSLKSLGYTEIWRTTDCNVMVSGSGLHDMNVKFLVDKNYKYNYYNFTFLDFTPTPIDGILSNLKE